MKLKTTSKELKRKIASNYLFKCGYCDLQTLFHFIDPIAYTSGIYGWNYDLYQIDDIYITTGYRSMIGQPIDYKLIRKYEEKAKSILYNYEIDFDKRKQKINNLVKKFVKELRK